MRLPDPAENWRRSLAVYGGILAVAAAGTFGVSEAVKHRPLPWLPGPAVTITRPPLAEPPTAAVGPLLAPVIAPAAPVWHPAGVLAPGVSLHGGSPVVTRFPAPGVSPRQHRTGTPLPGTSRTPAPGPTVTTVPPPPATTPAYTPPTTPTPEPTPTPTTVEPSSAP